MFFLSMELVALLSTGEGSWAQISGLIKHGEWDKIVVVGSEFAKKFTADKEFEFVKVDLSQKIKELRDDLSRKLKGKFKGTEVALTIASGDGKEHMALISALLNMPVGVRFAALTKEGVIDL
jgi:ERCC4-related helicase